MATKTVIEPKTCAGKVYENYRFYPCSRKAGESGFCGTHDPQKMKARSDKKIAKWEQENKAHQQKFRRDSILIASAPYLYKALMGLRAFMWKEGYADQTVEMAQADIAIEKYEASIE